MYTERNKSIRSPSEVNKSLPRHFFYLDSHLATLWESNCPFGFLLVMFPLESSYFVFVFFPFDVSDGRCGIIVSIPDHCLPFYFLYRRIQMHKY